MSFITKTPNLLFANNVSLEMKKDELKKYFNDTFTLYENLFNEIIKPNGYFIIAEQLRHPLIFYYAHTAVFFVNKFIAGKYINEKYRLNTIFESLFAIGVDEMSWDDINQNNYPWINFDDDQKTLYVKQISDYRKQVRNLVNDLIDSNDISLPINKDSFFYILLMGIEHERIHLETSTFIINRLPLEFINEDAPSWQYCQHCQYYQYCQDISCPEIKNYLVDIPGAEFDMGRSWDNTLIYGWDNEFGSKHCKLNDYKVSKYLVSNIDFLDFINDNGYENIKYWEEEGWEWVKDMNIKYPIFWIVNGNTYQFRSLLKIIDMPWNNPVITNHHEASAYCKWLSAKKDKNLRLISEEEWYNLRSYIKCNQNDWSTAPGNINLEYYKGTSNINIYKTKVNEEEIYDIIGNVWQHSHSVLKPFDNFTVHELYKDFTTPTYDGKHNNILGGSWISTGNLACKDSRYGFRRHFYQYAGIRYVESNNIIDNQINSVINDTLAKTIFNEFINANNYIKLQNFIHNINKTDQYTDVNIKMKTLIEKYNNNNIYVLNNGISSLPGLLTYTTNTIYYLSQDMNLSHHIESIYNGNKLIINVNYEGDLYETYILTNNNETNNHIINVCANNDNKILFKQINFNNSSDFDKIKHNKSSVFVMHNYIDTNEDYINVIKNIHSNMNDDDKLIFNTYYKNISKETLDKFINLYFHIDPIDPNDTISQKLLYDTKRKTTYTIHHIYVCSKKINTNYEDIMTSINILNSINNNSIIDVEYKDQHTLKMYEHLHYPELYNSLEITSTNNCYPVECANKCIEFVKLYSKSKLNLSALDLGGGIGRTALELIKSPLFDKVVGSDYSDVFVTKSISILDELKTNNFLSIPNDKLDNISFLKIDACNLPTDIKYDLIFGGNLIDRLPNPTQFLTTVSSILNENGILILTSPYTWLPEYTPKNKWIGGFFKDGEEYTTYDGLKNILNNYFDEIIISDNKIYFSIKESDNSYQSSCAEITYWIKQKK